MITIVDDPLTAFSYAARRVDAEDLAALSERYGLAPADAAALFAAAGVARDRAVEAVHLRCDHDIDATYEIALGILGATADDVTSVLVGDVPNIVDITSVTASVDAVDELVDAGVGHDAGMDP